MQKTQFDGRRLSNGFIRQLPPALPERLIRPARLDAIEEIALRQIGLPKFLQLRVVLPDEAIATAQFSRAVRCVSQRIMDQMPGVAGGLERLVDAL